MSFIENVLALIEVKGITRNKLLSDLNLAKNSFSNWIDRGTIPNGDTLLKIAEYFDVSIDYLLDRQGTSFATPHISLEIAAIMKQYGSLSDEGKKKALEYIEMLKDKEARDKK